jgi:hypothetical protein
MPAARRPASSFEPTRRMPKVAPAGRTRWVVAGVAVVVIAASVAVLVARRWSAGHDEPRVVVTPAAHETRAGKPGE